MSVVRQKARAFGRALEWRAAAWLVIKGYRILARNHSAQGGELDLVALSPERWIGRGELCFVEVRGRAAATAAHESVDCQKQARIERAVRDFIRRNPQYSSYPLRFDIIAAGRTGALIHSRRAFDA